MASYNIAYVFTHTLKGEGRQFYKDNQTITLKLRSTADKPGAQTFVVMLQRLILGVWWTEGRTAAFPMNGYKEHSWSGHPSGFYRVRFEKSTDNVTVRGAGTISN